MRHPAMASASKGRSRLIPVGAPLDHMSPLLSRCRLLLLVVALVGLCALAVGPSAMAQEPQSPTELWEEYPRAPGPDRSQAGSDAPQPRDQSRAAASAGDGRIAAASGEESFPLLQVVLALALLTLLLVLAFGMGALPRDFRVPKGVRERFNAVRHSSPRSYLGAAYASRRRDAEPSSEAAGLRGTTAQSGAHQSKGSDIPKEPARPPKAEAPPGHKKPATKRAKPAGAVKPQRVPKSRGAAKPAERAKPPGAVKIPKPAPSAKPKPPTRITPGTKPQTRRRTRGTSSRTELRPVEAQPPRLAGHAPSGRTLTCSIYGWRDGQLADFYAVAFGLQGRDWIVERSPRFFWPAGEIPDKAYEAHAILVDALKRAGWRLVGNEGAWYRLRFERPLAPTSEHT